jgi:hypothetical protein
LLIFANEAFVDCTVIAIPPETMDSRNGLRNAAQYINIAKLSCMVVVR